MGSYNSFFRAFNESAFSRAIYEAGTNRYRYHPYFIILDEMNLSRIEYYFADLLSIMEGRPEERAIELLNHDPTGGNLPKGLKQQNGAVKLPIPDNVWFVGTANTDESTYEITRKVYDRAQVLQIDEPFNNEKLGIAEKANLDIREFYAARANAIASLGNADRQAVQSCIEHIGMALNEYFQVGYGQRLLDQLFIFLPTYVAAGEKSRELKDKISRQVAEISTCLDSLLYKNLCRKPDVVSPLKPTNILTMDSDYRRIKHLWEVMDRFDSSPNTLEQVSNQRDIQSDYACYVYGCVLLSLRWIG